MHKTPPAATFHIIGGGIAGLSAARFIKQKNPAFRTVVYEAADRLGGRCYSYEDADLGCRLDNATHVILGANRSAAALLGQPQWDNDCWFWDAKSGSLSLNYKAHSNHILKSICNTPAENAAESVVKKIFWQMFPWSRRQRRIWFSRQDLSQYLINPQLAFVDELHLNRRLLKMDSQFGQAVSLNFGTQNIDLAAADKVILALDSRGCRALLGGEPFDYAGIINIVYRTSETLTLPKQSRLIGVINGLADWIFVSNNLVCVTISATRPDQTKLEELARRIWAELDHLRDVNSAFVPPFKIINHKVATIRQDEVNNAKRPDSAASCYPNVFLAGDWTMKDHPCCIETAILSAKRAVKEALKK